MPNHADEPTQDGAGQKKMWSFVVWRGRSEGANLNLWWLFWIQIQLDNGIQQTLLFMEESVQYFLFRSIVSF